MLEGMTHNNPSAVPPTPVDCMVANERDPRVFPFGVHAADSTVSVFSWYADATDALRSYVEQDLLIHLLDDQQTRDTVSRILGEALAMGEGLDTVAEALNAATGDDSVILWCGTFAELCGGEYAGSDVVDDFRGDSSEVSGPITPGEIAGFVEFIREHGR